MKPSEAKLAGQDASEKMTANADVDETEKVSRSEDAIFQKGLTSPSLVGLAVLVRSVNFIPLKERIQKVTLKGGGTIDQLSIQLNSTQLSEE